MSFRDLLNSLATVTRETADGFDDYGNTVIEWDEVFADIPVRLDEATGDELEQDRSTLTRRARLFVGAEHVLSALDRVEIDGVVWEVDGPPVPRQNRTGVHHFEIAVRAVTV